MTNDIAGVGMTPYAAVSTAVQAYFTYINREEGGVCGRTLTLDLRDDQYSAERSLDLVKAMTSGASPVLAMIGGLNTQIHRPVAEYLNDPDGDDDQSDGIPDLFVSTGWSGWGETDAYPWTIGLIPDYRSDARALGNYVEETAPDATVGLLYSDDEFGQDYRDALTAMFPEERLLAQPFPVDDDDVSDQVGALVAFEAEVMIIAAPPGVAAQAIDLARDGDDAETTFVLSYVNQPSNLASDLGGGSSAEQIIAGFQKLDGVVLTSYLRSTVGDEEHPATLEHVRIVDIYGGPAPSSLSIYGQTLAETLVETLERACPDLTRENVLAAAESLEDFSPSLLLPGIAVELSESDHRAIQAMQLWRINGDGTLDPIGDPFDAGP